jgi:2-dehydro-3-deoxygalactonokinase
VAILPNTCAIALDGGTSNTRVRLFEGEQLVATARRKVGVRDAVLDPAAKPLHRAVRECLAEVTARVSGRAPEFVVASGMLSSEAGLCQVPHVHAPAGIIELARSLDRCDLADITDRPLYFVPGVRTPGGPGLAGWSEADVMRGEECETIGAWLALGMRGAAVFLWPGSHTKLVALDRQGRIVRSHTTLAGELTAALAHHTILAASLPESLPDKPDAHALAAGARLVEREGLGRAAFLVRIADLTRTLDPAERASFLVGAVLADDVAHLAAHPILAGSHSVWVGGRQPQRALYAAWLSVRLGERVRELDDDLAERASALGAIAITHQRLSLRT